MAKHMMLYENDMLEVEILKESLQELRELEQRLKVQKAELRASCMLVMPLRYRLRY